MLIWAFAWGGSCREADSGNSSQSKIFELVHRILLNFVSFSVYLPHHLSGTYRPDTRMPSGTQTARFCFIENLGGRRRSTTGFAATWLKLPTPGEADESQKQFRVAAERDLLHVYGMKAESVEKGGDTGAGVLARLVEDAVGKAQPAQSAVRRVRRTSDSRWDRRRQADR